MKPSRTARYYYLRFIRLKGDPASVARGVAIGLYIGVTPTLPLHTVLILLFAYLLRGNTIAALIAATVISNPLTFVPQYYLSWKIGDLILPGDHSWQRIQEVIALLTSDAGFRERLTAVTHLGGETLFVMILGGCILAIPVALLGYVVTYKFFVKLHQKRQEKHLLK